MAYPNLTESGVKYFLRETLKKCHNKKETFWYFKYNILILLFIIVITYAVLKYKYITKPSKKDRLKKEKDKREYILHNIKKMQEKNEALYKGSITSLPKFTSPYEVLHKNFYNI